MFCSLIVIFRSKDRILNETMLRIDVETCLRMVVNALLAVSKSVPNGENFSHILLTMYNVT